MAGIHSRVLKKLEEVFTKVFPIIYLQSWVVSVDWKSANVTLCTSQKDDPGNYRAVSLTLVLGKVMGRSSRMQHAAGTGQPGNQAWPAWV